MATSEPSGGEQLAAGLVNARLAVLTASAVSKRYQSQDGGLVDALTASNFQVADGEFVSLVGPSGCGKTTLLKMSSGLIAPTHGEVTYRDTGRAVQPGAFGMVFQSPALLPWRTVGKNLLFPHDILRLDKSSASERIDELLDMVNLPGVRDRYPNELSGGMQQRVAIARSLMHAPDLLFMDEPFGALDAITREELNLSMQRIHSTSGTTVMFVTHDIAEAVFLSDRILVMSARPGRVVEIIEVDLERPRHLDSRTSAEFREIEMHIRHLLHPETVHAEAAS